MEDFEDGPAMSLPSPEYRELIGLFDVPAFARRARTLEDFLSRLREYCQRERTKLLEMVHMRLGQWARAATGPGDWHGEFTAPVAPLFELAGLEPPEWARQAGSFRARRDAARGLALSVDRFNRRWSAFVGKLDLLSVNEMIDRYNRYYVFEKECYLGSARLAARHFVARAMLSHADLLAEFPTLPVPQVVY